MDGCENINLNYLKCISKSIFFLVPISWIVSVWNTIKERLVKW